MKPIIKQKRSKKGFSAFRGKNATHTGHPQVSFTIELELLRAVNKLAIQHNSSTSAELRNLLRLGLKTVKLSQELLDNIDSIERQEKEVA